MADTISKLDEFVAQQQPGRNNRGRNMETLKDAFPGIESLSLVESFVELFCHQPLCLREFIDDLERGIILMTLSKVGGNQKKAAQALGMKYTTLNEKIRRYDIQFKKSPVYSPWYLERRVD
jgi:transcriptional regulator with GAF, ATPase, and Fis domain